MFDRHFAGPELDDDSLRSQLVTGVLSVWSWSALAAIVIAGFGVQLPLALATWSDKSRARPGRFVRDLGVLFAKLNPMWDFRIHGELPDYRPGKTVVVANHVSNSDAFLIAHLPWEMKWLSKASLFRV